MPVPPPNGFVVPVISERSFPVAAGLTGVLIKPFVFTVEVIKFNVVWTALFVPFVCSSAPPLPPQPMPFVVKLTTPPETENLAQSLFAGVDPVHGSSFPEMSATARVRLAVKFVPVVANVPVPPTTVTTLLVNPEESTLARKAVVNCVAETPQVKENV